MTFDATEFAVLGGRSARCTAAACHAPTHVAEATSFANSSFFDASFSTGYGQFLPDISQDHAFHCRKPQFGDDPTPGTQRKKATPTAFSWFAWFSGGQKDFGGQKEGSSAEEQLAFSEKKDGE